MTKNIYCTNCGSKNDGDASFCVNCGNKLLQMQQNPGIRQPGIQPPPEPQAPNNGNNWLIPLILTLVVAAGAVTAWRFIVSQPPGRDTTVATAPANGQQPERPVPGLPADPISAAKEAQKQAEEMVTGVFGGAHDSIGTVQNSRPLPPGLKDVENTAQYSYSPTDCTELMTDVMQQVGLAIGHQIAEATAISAKEENKLGRQLADELEKTYQDKLDPPARKKLLQYVQKVGNSIVPQVKRTGISYRFHIIVDDSFNAFAIPGGNIYVHTGLLDVVKNEAQLASVLAHEIAHVDLRHCVAVYQLLRSLPGAADAPMAATAAQMAGHPFQGRAEAEADTTGLKMIYQMGYSPFQVVRLWEQMSAADKGYGKGGQGITKKPADLLGDLFGQISSEMGNVLNDHPESGKRACILKNVTIKLLEAAPRELVYIGALNLRNMVAFVDKQY